MKESELKRESYLDIEDLIKDSLSDRTISEDKEDLVLEYLCQTISKSDSYESIKKRAEKGDEYAYIQLASWHVAYAENIKDYCLAFGYAKKAVRYGYTEGNYILGQLYYYGVGCERDIHLAAKCFRLFVEEINPKQLLNDSVLADAYLKLVMIEKKLGRYDKAGYYMKKLGKLSVEYKSYVEEYEQEIATQQKSLTCNFLSFIAFIVILCCAGIIVSHYMLKISNEYFGKYVQTAKVVIEEEEQMIEEPDVPTNVSVEP